MRSPMIVELAGPAGAGKSTVGQMAVQAGASGTIWGLPKTTLLKNGIRLLPYFIPLWQSARSHLWDETTHMMRLRALQELLERERDGKPVIFDEGPVFALARLRGFGHPVMRSLAADPWWQSTISCWAELIDVVVVLDAPDTLLAERIRARAIDHEVKLASDPEISVWMARFREALDWVLGELTKENGPVVVRLETAALPPQELAQQVLETLDRGVYAG
jgi:hypothetical protein